MNIGYFRRGGLALVLTLAGLPAAAQSVSQELVNRFRSEGFTHIEVRNGLTQTKVEAYRGSQKVEVIVDRATGAVLKSETETVEERRAGSGSLTVSSRNRDFVREDEDDDDRHRGHRGRGADDDQSDDDHGDDGPDHDDGDDHGEDGDHDSGGHGGHGGDDGDHDSGGHGGHGGDDD